MDTNDAVDKDTLGASPEGTKAADSVEQPADPDDANSKQNEPRLPQSPFDVPAPNSIIPRKAGARLNSGYLGRPFQRAQLDFKNKDEQNYQQKMVNDGPGAGIEYTTEFDMQEGKNSIHFRTVFDNYWSEWFTTGHFFAMTAVAITTPNGTVFETPRPTINGTGHPGVTVQLRQNGSTISPPLQVSAQRTWSIQTDELPAGPHQISVIQAVTGYSGSMSAGPVNITVELQVSPVIQSPVNGTVIRNLRPMVSGTGHKNATIAIHRAGNTTVSYGSGQVSSSSGQWSFTLTRDLPLGAFVMQAAQLYNTQTHLSNPVNITVRTEPYIPVITNPAQGSTQNPSFTVSGTGGEAGGKVRILIDLSSEKVGESQVLTGTTWSAPVVLPIGHTSVVAIQELNGQESERSLPRAFKIPPPALTSVIAEVLTVNSVKFSGDGHEDAHVEITIISGPAGAVPPVVQVVNGKWETTATNWPLGQYSLSAIQKVPDNSNGWIVSPAYTFPVKLVLGPATDVIYSLDYSPTFSGKG